MNKLLLLAYVILLSACSSLGGAKGTAFEALTPFKPGYGQIYIYRPSNFIMNLAIPTTKINNEKAPGPRNGSYMLYELPPGTHQFSLTRNSNWAAGDMHFAAEINEKERRFYRLSAAVDDVDAYTEFVMIRLNGRLVEVTEAFAIQEMQALKFTGIWPNETE